MAAKGTSLRTYLIVPAVFFVFIATSVSWYQRDAAQDEARRSATRDAQFAAEVAAEELDSGIEAAASQVATTAASPSIAAIFEAPAGCTLTFASSAPLVAGHIDIVAADGTVLCTSLENGSSKTYAGAEWLAAALVGPLIDGRERDVRTNENALVISSPIDARGAIVTFIDLKSIGPGLAGSFGGPRDLEFVVTASGGETVTRSGPAETDRDSQFYGSASVERTKWRVFAAVEKSEALKAVNTVSNRQVAAVAVALTLALITLRMMYRKLAHPIAKLSSAVQAATEDLSAEPIDVAGPREIRALVDDFNSLVEVARRERALEERLRRAEKVDEHERELRLLADRERIGRDLHDTVIQHLFATGMALDSVTGRIADSQVRDKVSAAVDDIDATIREVRAAIFDMERGGSATATQVLRSVVENVSEGLGFQPSLRFAGPVDEAVPAHVADQMAAALRESLTNAARHSSAGQVEVAVNVGSDIVMTVRDNGVGIGDAVATGGGLGLNSMRARAERLGGRFKIDRHPGGGTLVEWRVPRGATTSN